MVLRAGRAGGALQVERRRRARVPRRAQRRRRAHGAQRARAGGRRRPRELGEGTGRRWQRAEDALQRRAVLYDKGGDRHYDYISAWIKATRGSDPDASLYYLAVMLEGGEDPRFIVRRMVILASEDIGNADPQALSVATAAAAAVEHVGLPEAPYALAQAAIYLVARAEVRRRRPGARRPPSAHVREHGAGARAGWLRSGPADRRPGPAAATRTPTAPGHLGAAGAAAGGRRRASASTSPTRPRPRLPSACEAIREGAGAPGSDNRAR